MKKFVFLLITLLIIAGVYLLKPLVMETLSPIRNVLLISIDTCRPDYLSCYGYEKQTTPNIDKLAHQGILVKNAYSPAPLTLPAHSSMFTGLIPPFHGVRDNGDYSLGKLHLTLAEFLKSKGYSTSAFVSSYVLNAKYGLAQGFDDYFDIDSGQHNVLELSQRTAEETNKHVFDWLEKRGDNKFFMFVHYFDPHSLYSPPEPFASEYKDVPYAGEIAYVDSQLGHLFNKLKEEGLDKSTLIVLTSDHGEMLFEHKEPTHGIFVYQSSLKIPLILKVPGGLSSTIIDNLPIGLTDIPSTICGLLGLKFPVETQGEDFSQSFRSNDSSNGGKRERPIYFESFYAYRHYNASPLRGILAGKWKFISAPRQELYNIYEDQLESNNLFNDENDISIKLNKILNDISEKEEHLSPAQVLAVSEKDRKIIESLGYVTMRGNVSNNRQETILHDPKDIVDFHVDFLRAVTRRSRKQYAEAETRLLALIEQNPAYFPAYEQLYQISLGQNNNEKAYEYLQKIVEIGKAASSQPKQIKPDLASAFFRLAILADKTERHEKTEYFLQQTLKHNPRHFNALMKLGKLYIASKKYSDALPVLQKAQNIQEDSSELHYHLGFTYSQLSIYEKAIEEYILAIEGFPNYLNAHINLGLIYFNTNDLEKAIYHFKAALKIDSSIADLHNNIGAALARMNKMNEAILQFQEALIIDPENKNAKENLIKIKASRI